MGLTFKSAIEQDNKSVFLNSSEFGEVHEINGKEMPVIIDDNELLERDKAHLLNADISGLHYSRRLLYVAASYFDVRPDPDSFLQLDADLYRVKSATEEAGIYAIEIEAVRT